MDSAIAPAIIQRRKRKMILWIILAVAGLITLLWIFRQSLSSSIKRTEIITARVEKGNVDNTITATGEVQPEFEEVITSPINAVIKSVLIDAGSPVKSGQSVLELDKAFTEIELAKLKFQLELKENNIARLKLQLDKSFYDLQANDSIKQLRINSLQAAVQDAKRLFKAGGGTREEVEQAELDLKIAQLEKRQLENEIRNKQMTMRTDMRDSELSAQIQRKDLDELERKLQQANIVASRDGVITWVNKNIGSQIGVGASLVKVADLASYRVVGSISDAFAEQVKTGMPVIARINDSLLRGTVANIHPTIQNNIMSFDVQLDNRSSKLLRPNMKLDIFLVTATSNGVLRVANGAAFKGTAVQDIFVVQGNKAVRRTVHLGLSNFDYVELKDQVTPGEVIITTDMSQYKHLQEITLKD
ncbi:HlyD family efflux transporter periplasmic adaptor subunit [Paraflavitalea sp. CAU 1676]|uniref:efflux RND transporter periplasmic adaptor subunit n=1 Tax=Paraflavitalea sp. CAU 1676 TaxID=3032598 RepID=UPI0023DA439F|nr:HlyD family efflux transporter periplasmic adaptor subunit [Paraflavitalea sp. CAU 1676]MDF2191127.1 HlyD family efflux transporter periplasmic adaptor subunit [Paraflavitalea sp. CAU 1676]